MDNKLNKAFNEYLILCGQVYGEEVAHELKNVILGIIEGVETSRLKQQVFLNKMKRQTYISLLEQNDEDIINVSRYISDVCIYRGIQKGSYRCRCKVNGEQQSSYPLTASHTILYTNAKNENNARQSPVTAEKLALTKARIAGELFASELLQHELQQNQKGLQR